MSKNSSSKNVFLLIVIPLAILLLFETVCRGSLLSTLAWIVQYPKQFLITYSLLFAAANLFYILPRRLYLAANALLLCALTIVGFVSRQKLALRGEPLLPWDLILGKEALNISSQLSLISVDISLIGSLLVVIAVFVVLFKLPREPYRFKRKAVVSLLSFVLLFSVYTEALPLKSTFSLRLINWSQEMNYEENGMLLGFWLNCGYLNVAEPESYSPATVASLINRAKTPYPVNPKFQPNIILVMSEAFWDPTVLDHVEFNQDPIPYFHDLQQNHTRGTLISPVYGGGTANTEFEVLTGFSTEFLPRGLIPYVQYVHRPVDALPSILKRQGYETSAIHTYHNWFYRRNYVYQDLGFDKFISKEFFSDPEYGGPYIRDTELSKKILEEIKASDKPDFIYAISMQAHGPYSKEPDPDNSIEISGNLTPESKAILENYTQLISDVDQSLKLLIEGLEQLNEPSIVVFFGDHLPMLGDHYDVYNETGYFQDDSTYDDYLKMYSVPFVVWDNFSDTPPNAEELRLSSSFLSSYVLARAQKEGSLLTDYLYALKQSGKSVVVRENYQERESLTENDFKTYRMLQYDLLLGNEYAYQLKPKSKPLSNPDYILGDGRTVIENASPPDQSTIYIEGENFQIGHTVYINGQPVETNYDNNNHLVASLPWYFKHTTGTLEIQLKLHDSMGNVISESNTFELPLS